TAAGSALVIGGMGLQSFETPEIKTLTLLHTNDVHSHIDPFPVNDPKYPNEGGAARRATLIQQVRQEQGEDNVLLLDAGDVFQGTPYFNYYGGELEIKLMSMMKYDIATMGNHDFDNGIEGFLKQLPHATFPFISANYDFKNTVLNGIVEPYKIFTKNGIKVGVFGLGIELNGLVDKKLYKETVYLNPIEIAQDMSRILKVDKKCDLVICLSHLGFSYGNENQKVSDVTLARNTKNIDLIIGGHTHTFLSTPHIEKNIDGQEVMINQVGCYGLNVGRIDFTFESGKKTSSGRLLKV
ncbi:MAG: metallophosphatase, partial [Bacteroidota bacterium]